MLFKFFRRLHLRQAFKCAVVISLLWICFSSIWSHFRKSKPTPKGFVSRISVSDVQGVLDYVAENLRIEYHLAENEEASYLAHLKLKNIGSRTIQPCCFSIFFHHLNVLDALNVHYENLGVGRRKYFRDDTIKNTSPAFSIFEISHVNGNSYRLDMTSKFGGLLPEEELVINLSGFRWIVSRSTIIPNWYVASSIPTTQPRLIRSTVGDDLKFVAPFDSTEKTSRSSKDVLRPFSPLERFERNGIKDFGDASSKILPTPSVEVRTAKELHIESEIWRIYYSNELKNEAYYLKDQLHIDSLESFSNQMACVEKSLVLRLDPGLGKDNSDKGRVPSQRYKLTVDAGKECVTIAGVTPVGVFYGVVSAVSLMKLLSPTEFLMPAVEVIDSPRFEHRGLMVDVARNFQTKEKMKQLIDLLAMYKMNVLHIHLTDDEGWRLEIPGLPELTEFGGFRDHDPKEKNNLMSMLGSGPFNDTTGSGFYTVADYREILQHALSRHVEIIPEFDMPGHSHAAIQSMEYRRARLTAGGHVAQSKDYLLHDPDDKSRYTSAQFFFDGVINPCQESSYRFVHHVVSEVSRMHKDIMPLNRFHFGGDEVPHGVYAESPVCQKFLESHAHLSGPKDLKEYFIRRVSEIVDHFGLEVEGWEDAFSNASGSPMPMSDFKSKSVISQAWYNIWEQGYTKRAYDYANQGYKVILTPATAVYFDHPHEPDPEEWGLHWATRYIDIKRTFFFAPESLYDNIDFDLMGNRISKQQLCNRMIECPPLKSPENIIGMEAAIWSELIRSPDLLDHMIWPRLLAVAERAWHKADWEVMPAECEDGGGNCTQVKERRDARNRGWTEFANTIGHKELKRLEALGIKYHLPRPGARVVNGKLEVNSLFPGLIVQTSADQGRTWLDYDPNSSLSGSVLVATRSFDGERRSAAVKVTID